MSTSEAPPPRRRFHLGDSLILIAALALTLSVLLSTNWFARIPGRVSFWWDARPRVVGGFPRFLTWGPSARMAVYQIVDEFVQLLTSVLLGLTLVQPFLRLRRPRPPLRDVVRQSGFVVCLAVIVGTLIVVDLGWVARIDVAWVAILASALLLFWPVLGLPPWRSEASWIDRLGRAVGWGWIVAIASAIVLIGL
jgi:hypothetical protein